MHADVWAGLGWAAAEGVVIVRSQRALERPPNRIGEQSTKESSSPPSSSLQMD